MKRKKFTTQQIAQILKEFEAGKSAAGISREYGVSQAAFYNRTAEAVETALQWYGCH